MNDDGKTCVYVKCDGKLPSHAECVVIVPNRVNDSVCEFEWTSSSVSVWMCVLCNSNLQLVVIIYISVACKLRLLSIITIIS